MRRALRAELRAGLTLVELVVVTTLLVILAGGLLTSYLSSQATFLSAEAAVEVQQQARAAMENMVRELREAGNVSTTILPNSAIQLNFQIDRGYNQAGCANAVCWGSENALGEWVHYSIIGDAGNQRQLIRCVDTSQAGAITALGAGCRVLANEVRHPNAAGTAAFVWDSADRTVTMNLEIQFLDPRIPTGAQTSGALTSRVTLRN